MALRGQPIHFDKPFTGLAAREFGLTRLRIEPAGRVIPGPGKTTAHDSACLLKTVRVPVWICAADT
jgi:hypothetical protein